MVYEGAAVADSPKMLVEGTEKTPVLVLAAVWCGIHVVIMTSGPQIFLILSQSAVVLMVADSGNKITNLTL